MLWHFGERSNFAQFDAIQKVHEVMVELKPLGGVVALISTLRFTMSGHIWECRDLDGGKSLCIGRHFQARYWQPPATR
jgi:hypothetical protein